MMTAEKLKASILNLAFSGKLVEQRNNEESPAGILHYLAGNNSKNKKIIQIVKKQDGLRYLLQNNRTVCVEENLLFDIPSTWEWTSLKNVSSVLYGFPFDSAMFNDFEDGIPLIRIRDVLPGVTKTYTTEKCSDEYIIENGDMLVGMDGNFNVNFWNGGKAYLNQRVCRIKAREEILDQKYLSYYLPLEFDRISKNVSYVTVKHLSDKHLNSLFIPIPPLAEQKRIVAKIEELMPFVEQYAAASTKLNTLNASFPEMMKKSILQEAVQGKLVPQDPNDEPASVLLKKIAEEKKRLIKEGKIKKQKPLPEITEDEIPFDIPESWEWVRFSQVINIEPNLVKPEEHQEKLQIAPDSIGKGNGVLLHKRTVKESGVKSPNHFFYKGQILYSKIRPALRKVVEAPSNGLCSADMYPLSTIMDNHFVIYYMLSDTFTSAVTANANRVKMPKVNQEELNNVLVPVPPLNEQKRIAKRLDILIPQLGYL